LSPRKGKTIEKFLEVIFKWSLVTDMPTCHPKKLVDVENGFKPKYEVSADKSIGYQIKRFSKKKRKWFG
jgi:DNA topoisomerase-1